MRRRQRRRPARPPPALSLIHILKDAEQAETERHDGPNMAWIPGLVLIGIGLVFLLNNFTDFELHNWWALFILIPAFASLGNFWRAYRSAGRLGNDARGSLIGAMILFFVACLLYTSRCV